MPLADILILSNGPGELTTWVRPTVMQLRKDIPHARLSLVLAPCAHASGNEVELARRHLNVDRIQGPEHFFRFLRTGKTAEDWDWAPFGVVLFLGGDQFFAVWLGRRLGYRVVVYAEWETRWRRWVDAFAVRNQDVLRRSPRRWRHKMTEVGDLMADGITTASMPVLDFESNMLPQFKTSLSTLAQPTVPDSSLQSQTLPEPLDATVPDSTPSPVPEELPVSLPWQWAPLQSESRQSFQIGLLPGSKPSKLSLGVPMFLAVADHLREMLPSVKFAIPVAPTIDTETLAAYAEVSKNMDIATVLGTSAVCEQGGSTAQLVTPFGSTITLWREFPAYPLLANCDLCITTVGANTAELARLGVPMVVVLPTNKLDVMKAWDGIVGLLVNLPVIGTPITFLVNWVASHFLGNLAWPNIWAKREIVPEIKGKLTPLQIAKSVQDLLLDEDRYRTMRQELKAYHEPPGATTELAAIIKRQLALTGEPSSEAAQS